MVTYKDSLIKVWVRESYDIQVESKEDFEAQEELMTPYNTEYMWETEEPIYNSKGEPINEIFISDCYNNDSLIYSNVED